MVRDVFNEQQLSNLVGSLGVGHGMCCRIMKEEIVRIEKLKLLFYSPLSHCWLIFHVWSSTFLCQLTLWYHFCSCKLRLRLRYRSFVLTTASIRMVIWQMLENWEPSWIRLLTVISTPIPIPNYCWTFWQTIYKRLENSGKKNKKI